MSQRHAHTPSAIYLLRTSDKGTQQAAHRREPIVKSHPPSPSPRASSSAPIRTRNRRTRAPAQTPRPHAAGSKQGGLAIGEGADLLPGAPIPADSPGNAERSPESAPNRAESPVNRPPRRRGGGPAGGLGGESDEREARRGEREGREGGGGGVVVFGLGERGTD